MAEDDLELKEVCCMDTLAKTLDLMWELQQLIVALKFIW